MTPADRPGGVMPSRAEAAMVTGVASTTNIRVLVAEDTFLAREGILRALESADEIEVVGVCEDYDSAMRAVDELRPDLVLTDIRMPPTNTDEGLRIATELRESHPEIAVVILSQHAEAIYAATLFEAGTAGRGYLLKEQLKNEAELRRALQLVASGGSYVDPAVLGPLIVQSHNAASRLSDLTPRELAILRLVAEGYSNASIAELTGITVRGVERHVNSIFSKLRLADTGDLNRRVRAALIYVDAMHAAGMTDALSSPGER